MLANSFFMFPMACWTPWRIYDAQMEFFLDNECKKINLCRQKTEPFRQLHLKFTGLNFLIGWGAFLIVNRRSQSALLSLWTHDTKTVLESKATTAYFIISSENVDSWNSNRCKFKAQIKVCRKLLLPIAWSEEIWLLALKLNNCLRWIIRKKCLEVNSIDAIKELGFNV